MAISQGCKYLISIRDQFLPAAAGAVLSSLSGIVLMKVVYQAWPKV